jgi:hypothetical protein
MGIGEAAPNYSIQLAALRASKLRLHPIAREAPAFMPGRDSANSVAVVVALQSNSVCNKTVKLTLQTQLLPTPEQAASLEATMRALNAAADWLAGEAFARKTANRFALQKLFYRDLRERFGLSAQKPRAASRRSAKPTSATRPSAHISAPSPLSPTISG